MLSLAVATPYNELLNKFFMSTMEEKIVERAKFNYLIQIIKDYPNVPKYLHEREDEILHPWRDTDGNIGGGRATPSNGQERLLVKLSDDRRLNAIRTQYDAVGKCLASADPDTFRIINELCLQKHQYLTVDGLAKQMNITPSAIRKRKAKFVEALADELGV